MRQCKMANNRLCSSARLHWLGLLWLLLTAGCTHQPFLPFDAAENDPRWNNHREQNQAIDQWSLRGKVAVSGSYGLSARMRWQQVGFAYEVRVTAPLGIGGFVATGDNEQVFLQTSRGEQLSGDPEKLIAEAYGWSFPLESLKYWAVGVPIPDQRFTVSLNESGQAAQLSQAGWTIDYGDYDSVSEKLLPTRITLFNDDVTLKIVVGRWTHLF